MTNGKSKRFQNIKSGPTLHLSLVAYYYYYLKSIVKNNIYLASFLMWKRDKKYRYIFKKLT